MDRATVVGLANDVAGRECTRAHHGQASVTADQSRRFLDRQGKHAGKLTCGPGPRSVVAADRDRHGERDAERHYRHPHERHDPPFFSPTSPLSWELSDGTASTTVPRERRICRRSSRNQTGNGMGASGAEGKGGPPPRFFLVPQGPSHRARTTDHSVRGIASRLLLVTRDNQSGSKCRRRPLGPPRAV